MPPDDGRVAGWTRAMPSAPAPAKPTLAPLRAVSDALDEVELDLESVQRDLVLAERAGMAVLVVTALVAAGVVAVVVLRRLRRRRDDTPVVPEERWPPVPTAPAPDVA